MPAGKLQRRIKQLPAGYSRLIQTCISVGDITPLMPLTWRDVIYLQTFEEHREASRLVVFQDMAFYLHRISCSLTGDSGLNFLPSEVMRMSINMERRMESEG